MIKKGDIIKANAEVYCITNEKVYCVALTDEVKGEKIKVMVIEDNNLTTCGDKAIGKVFTVQPRYFDVVDYTDVNAKEKDRVLKIAMKLCKRSRVVCECINRYIEDRQIGFDMISPFMDWGYASDNGKKFTILEFNFSYLPILIVFGLGVIIGILSTIKIIRHFLETARPQMIYLILGLMIGSLYAVFMGPTTLEVPQPPMSLSTFNIIFFIIGGAVIIGLEQFSKVIEKKHK